MHLWLIFVPNATLDRPIMYQKFSNDTEHRAVSLRQLSFLFSLALVSETVKTQVNERCIAYLFIYEDSEDFGHFSATLGCDLRFMCLSTSTYVGIICSFTSHEVDQNFVSDTPTSVFGMSGHGTHTTPTVAQPLLIKS